MFEDQEGNWKLPDVTAVLVDVFASADGVPLSSAIYSACVACKCSLLMTADAMTPRRASQLTFTPLDVNADATAEAAEGAEPGTSGRCRTASRDQLRRAYQLAGDSRVGGKKRQMQLEDASALSGSSSPPGGSEQAPHKKVNSGASTSSGEEEEIMDGGGAAKLLGDQEARGRGGVSEGGQMGHQDPGCSYRHPGPARRVLSGAVGKDSLPSLKIVDQYLKPLIMADMESDTVRMKYEGCSLSNGYPWAELRDATCGRGWSHRSVELGLKAVCAADMETDALIRVLTFADLQAALKGTALGMSGLAALFNATGLGGSLLLGMCSETVCALRPPPDELRWKLVVVDVPLRVITVYDPESQALVQPHLLKYLPDALWLKYLLEAFFHDTFQCKFCYLGVQTSHLASGAHVVCAALVLVHCGEEFHTTFGQTDTGVADVAVRLLKYALSGIVGCMLYVGDVPLESQQPI